MTRLGMALALVWILLPAACGGGESTPDPGPAVAAEATPPADPNRIVVRYDHDGDGCVDTLTLDAARNPVAVVAAIRGAPDGGGTDVGEAWRGAAVDPALNEALQVHLARTFSVAYPTALAVRMRGAEGTVVVIE